MLVRTSVVCAALLAATSACGDDTDDPATTSAAGGSATGGSGSGTGGNGGNGSGGAATGGGAPGPNCAGLAQDCGATQANDCCLSELVSGGSFLRSYDGATFNDMGNPATVSSFGLDVYEVTVGRFRAFVDAGMGTQPNAPAAGAGEHPLIADSGWNDAWNMYLMADSGLFRSALACDNDAETWTDAPAETELLPINCNSWFEAFAFCVWDGGRLPTEAEWNYAAAGGDEQREYPWGAGIDPTFATHGCLANGDGDCVLADVLAVGAHSPRGDGRWGHADLAGNMWEWVLDWYEVYPNPCVDCARTIATPYNVRRGGGWGSPPGGLLASQRDFVTAADRTSDIGIRCARMP